MREETGRGIKNWGKDMAAVLSLLGVAVWQGWPWLAGEGYPPAESEAPATVALAWFVRRFWPNLGWYPLWYLGLPFRQIGETLPAVMLAGLNWLGVDFWTGFRWLAVAGVAASGVGVFYLGKRLAGRGSGWVAGLLWLIMPSLGLVFAPVRAGVTAEAWRGPFFSLAVWGNLGKIWGLAVAPVCLLTTRDWLEKKLKRPFWPILGFVLLGLIDLGSWLMVWVVAGLYLLALMLKGRLGESPRRLGRVFWRQLALLGFFYSPGFWWRRLMAPSLAGKGLASVMIFLGRYLGVLMAMVLGFWASGGKKVWRREGTGRLWVTVWAGCLGLLTVSRWLADVDFWRDYTAWSGEWTLGMIFCLVLTAKRQKIGRGLLIVLIPLIIILNFKVHFDTFGMNGGSGWRETRAWEGEMVDFLTEKMEKGERVFLSGSPVFWLNEKVDLAQVRGGRDEAAGHPFWDRAAWEIREGEKPELSLAWLRVLGVSWLAVHGPGSAEPFGDFRRPEKFEKLAELVKMGEGEGDAVYKVTGANLVREVEKTEIWSELREPESGEEEVFLEKYLSALGKGLVFTWKSPGELVFESRGGQPVSVAVSFERGWQATQGKERLRVERDVLGQVVVYPKREGEVRLRYFVFGADQLAGWLAGLWGLSGLF